MTRQTVSVIISLVFLLAACVSASATKDPCGSRGQWEKCAAGSCAACACAGLSEQAPARDELLHLVAALENPNECQINAAVGVLPHLSGGDLEDLMRALAALTATHPQAFLEVLVKRQTDRSRIESIVRMLPLSSVDNDPLRRNLVRARIESLNRVTDERLRHTRDVAVQALKDYAAELR